MEQGRYKVLLLDLDGTIMDFDATERESLAACFAAAGVPATPEVLAQYKRFNDAAWAACERGERTKDDVVGNRFVALFDALGRARAESDRQLEADYQAALGRGAHLIEGAKELCQALKGRYSLYIVSNGVSATQASRLAAAGLTDLFDGVFVSDDMGYQKPMKEYFDACFARMEPVDKSSVLLVGDSLTADMQGGINAGVDTCWFNPAGAHNKNGLPVTYEIASLSQLPDILGE